MANGFKAKYGNVCVDANVNGRFCHFRSKLEFRYAQYLDILLKAEEIKDFFYEFHTFRFPDDCALKEYTPDFLVRMNDNTFEYHETKGMLSGYDIKKYKILFDQRPAVKLIIVFWQKPKISTIKRNQLERFCHRIIWDIGKTIRNLPIDMD